MGGCPLDRGAGWYPNFAGRVVLSKYRRRPTALVAPPHRAPVLVVPTRVRIFSDRLSLAPFIDTGVKLPKATLASLARSALRVISKIQRVSPEVSNTPLR